MIQTYLVNMKFSSIATLSLSILSYASINATKFSSLRTSINKDDKNKDAAGRSKRKNHMLTSQRSNYLRMLKEEGSVPSIVQASIIEEAMASEEVANDIKSCPSWGEFRNEYPAIGRTTIQLVDESRDDRTLAVDIWYPAENNGEQASDYNPILPPIMMKGVYAALDSPEVLPPEPGSSFPLLIFSMGA